MGQGVKFLDHLPDIALVFTEAEALFGQRRNADLPPLVVEGVSGARFQLIGTHPVDHLLQGIAIGHRLGSPHHHGGGIGKAFVLLHAVEVHRYHRDMGKSGLLQRQTDKGHISWRHGIRRRSA